MDYYELRSQASKLVPGVLPLDFPRSGRVNAVKEKGRKANYKEFSLITGEWQKKERLLNVNEIKSFLEISIRAAACPMPMNADTWDGLLCVEEGTLVLTETGKRPIESIAVGERVWSFNERTGNPELAEVTAISSTVKLEFIEIETDAGKLSLTPDHEVLTQRGWLKAENLIETDTLLTIR